MRIGFDVAQTCTQRAGCGWYADSLIRALVEVAPENDYFLYHQFGDWINDDVCGGTVLDHPSVQMPYRDKEGDCGQRFRNGDGRESLPGEPEIVQSNSFQVIPTGGAKLVFVVFDVSFWIYPEFTTEANRLNCQRGVLGALKSADGLLFISESGRREFETALPGFLERTGKPSAAISLASRFDGTWNGTREESFWLSVGSIEPRKNYDALFSAMEIYWCRSHRRLPLHVAAGGGWKNDGIRNRAQRLQEEGKVKLLGYVEDLRLRSLYQTAMALIFPSWYEGFGLPVLEAMQHGCPVICSDRTSLPEVGGEVPVYVDPANAESIADAMLAMENNADLRRQRSETGRERAKGFTWQRTARDTLEFYRRVLDV